jgi:hypothetical protein
MRLYGFCAIRGDMLVEKFSDLFYSRFEAFFKETLFKVRVTWFLDLHILIVFLRKRNVSKNESVTVFSEKVGEVPPYLT